MFDIGFSELIVIGIVALVVIGPERLPKVARTLNMLFGRLQRYVTQVKSDINREMDLSELNRVKTEFEGAARSFQQDVESKAADTEKEIREAQSSIDRELAGSATDSVLPGAAPAEGAASAAPAPDPFPRGLIEEPGAPPEEPRASPQMELGIEDTDAAPARERKAG
jgi:sec-independent protein translocase protein TatB